MRVHKESFSLFNKKNLKQNSVQKSPDPAIVQYKLNSKNEFVISGFNS